MLLNSSKDCINWNMLTPASDDAKELVQLCQGRFTGDPSHEFEVTKYNITSEDTEEENVEEYKVEFIDLIDIFYF
jgi:radial spoke head protein 9